MLTAIVIGFLFGFVGSVPLAGPIAVLVFAAAVDGRFKNALYIGLGCALAEAFYATLAFWGFSTFLTRYPAIVPITRVVAAVILIVLGIVFMRQKPGPEDAAPVVERRGRSFLLGFSITALNPTLIGTWAAAVTVLLSTGLVDSRPSLSVPFGLGVCAGIAAWYALLIELVARFKRRFRRESLNMAVRAMGVVLVGIGLWAAWLSGDYFLGG